MEIVYSLLSKYGIAVAAIAAFCYSIIAAFRRVSVLEANKHFKAWLPITPSILGGGLGACIPWIFPQEEPAALRAFIGVIAGSNAANIVAFGRRIAKLIVTRKTSAATADTLFAPVDEGGSTLPPTGEITKGEAAKVDQYNQKK